MTARRRGSLTEGASVAREHEAVTILFADIVSFTTMCNEVPAQAVMAFLNDLFTKFDALVEQHGVYKVETIGDCYMVAGGLIGTDRDGFRSVTTELDPDHARKVFAFAVDMLEAARNVRLPNTGGPVQLRVGIHSGPVTSGVVGSKMPRFCLFGDTVNTASRMESNSQPGHIHCSDPARRAIGGMRGLPAAASGAWMPPSNLAVKGKGTMVTHMFCPSHGTP